MIKTDYEILDSWQEALDYEEPPEPPVQDEDFLEPPEDDGGDLWLVEIEYHKHTKLVPRFHLFEVVDTSKDGAIEKARRLARLERLPEVSKKIKAVKQ